MIGSSFLLASPCRSSKLFVVADGYKAPICAPSPDPSLRSHATVRRSNSWLLSLRLCPDKPACQRQQKEKKREEIRGADILSLSVWTEADGRSRPSQLQPERPFITQNKSENAAEQISMFYVLCHHINNLIQSKWPLEAIEIICARAYLYIPTII